MPKKPMKGDIAVIHAEIHKVWDDGRVTVHIPGYPAPVTLHLKHVDDITTKSKPEKPPKGPTHSDETPLWDDPTPKKKV